MSNPDAATNVDRAARAQYDMIIDVRSPGEFAEDHVPGAVNLPVLDNEERARVGTIYVQESAFLARRIGAALVAKNASRHLEEALADKPADFKPLVYCWRGGQRSNSLALILAQVGWRTMVLKGGYKTYRRLVLKRLYDDPLDLKLILLDGGTGSGKTDILQRAEKLGAQVIDLEGLAKHRGSLFGALEDEPQPTQKMFESRLLHAIEGLDPSRPILVEAESNKIGERTLPPSFWTAMRAAPRIEINAPLEARADYLVGAYPELLKDRPKLSTVLSKLEVYPGRKRLENWRDLADEGHFADLAKEVVELHYDPAYERSRKRDERPLLKTIAVESLDEASLDAAAEEVCALLEGL